MLVALIAGALLGLALGTVGGGGAVLAVPVLVYLLVSAIGLGEHLATDTRIAWSVALPFAAAALFTASFGGTIARGLPQRTLARTFALMLAGIAGYVLVSIAALGGPPNG